MTEYLSFYFIKEFFAFYFIKELTFTCVILATLIYIFSNTPESKGFINVESKVNMTFTFIIVGFFSVSYTDSVINLTDLINIPSILAHISDNFFLSSSIPDLPNFNNKCVNIIDISNLKVKHHNDFFFAKQSSAIIGQRPFIFINNYGSILKYKYLILPIAAKISYNIISKFDLMELCTQVRQFLSVILRLFKTYFLPISPTYTNYQVYSTFYRNYPTALLNERINRLYDEINSLLSDTRVRVNQFEDYLRENDLYAVRGINNSVLIESTEVIDLEVLDIHASHIGNQISIFNDEYLRTEDLLRQLRNLETEIASENTSDAFQRSDTLIMLFVDIYEEFSSLIDQ